MGLFWPRPQYIVINCILENVMGEWLPPLVDMNRGVVYFRCPEWAECEKCDVACGFNPRTPFYCHNCRRWMGKKRAGCCERQGHRVEKLEWRR